ncbi:hypothetical protein OG21DRAFT_1250042 [Imleria badia]|nr:hypothetical protein OG21DRAFT_1250042 [Imleria badia]
MTTTTQLIPGVSTSLQTSRSPSRSHTQSCSPQARATARDDLAWLTNQTKVLDVFKLLRHVPATSIPITRFHRGHRNVSRQKSESIRDAPKLSVLENVVCKPSAYPWPANTYVPHPWQTPLTPPLPQTLFHLMYRLSSPASSPPSSISTSIPSHVEHPPRREVHSSADAEHFGPRHNIFTFSCPRWSLRPSRVKYPSYNSTEHHKFPSGS